MKISFRQIYALLWRNYKIMIGQIKVNLILILSPTILCLLIRYVMKRKVSGRFFPGLIVLFFQFSLIRKTTTFFVEERAKKFLATYKLMGLRQLNYTLGMLGSFYLLSIFSLIPNMLLGLYIFDNTGFDFWLLTMLFVFSSTNYGVLLSVLIRNPNIASDMAGLFTFALSFL